MAHLLQIFGSMIENLSNDIWCVYFINYLKMVCWIDIMGNYIIYSCEENNNAWSDSFCVVYSFLSKMSLEHVTSIRMNNIRNYSTWLLGASFYLHIETYYRMKIRWNIISCLTNLTFIIIKNIVFFGNVFRHWLKIIHRI